MSSKEAAHPESLWEVGRRQAVHESCSLRRKIITGVGSGTSLALALLALAFTSESREGVRSSSTSSLEEASHMRWDPRHVLVQAPGLTVFEARAMHSLAQQKQWANLFTRRRTASSMLQQVPAAVSASGRARLAKAREGMLAGNSWQTEEGDWIDRSSPDDPASINVRQVYEYVPNADGRRMSDGHGAKMWNDLQRSDFLQKPSMATYPVSESLVY